MRNIHHYGKIRYLAGVVGLLFIFLIAAPVRAAGDEETIAQNFLKFLQSGKTILLEEVIERSLLDPALAPIPVAHLFHLEGGGYILVSKDRSISPVKAYSLVGDFASLPEAYRAALLAELELRSRVALSGAGRTTQETGATETEARWDFLLNFDAARLPLEAYVPDTFLVQSKWNQSYPYNKFLPAIGDQTVLAGCVNVALAQIMRYHRYPAAAKGVLSYIWTDQTTVPPTQTTLKTILYRGYDWDNMPDSADGTTPEYQADEIALLIKDLGIANRTAFGISDSSTSFRPDILKENFGYSTALAQMDNATNFDVFLQTIKDEILAGRPVLMAFPTHMVVTDGYSASDAGRKIHINMGWGGKADDFYFLDQPVPKGNGTSFDTSPGNLSINYNIKPCSGDDCAVNLEGGDGINGLTITGNFDRAKDADIYEAYLKGSTTFSATRGYSNVAFNVSIINATDGSEAFELADPSEPNSANKVISAGNLQAGKYLIRVALCDGGGWCYSPNASFDHYTVTLTTDTVSAEEKAAIDQGLNKPPVIGNAFPDIILNAAASPLETRRLLIDARDENGDAIALSLANSNPAAVTAVLNGKILEITPTGTAKVASRIVVIASANGQMAEKTFTVMTDSGQTAFGKSFTVAGAFLSQHDVQNIPAILEGDCLIQGDNGYPSQAFFSSVLDSSGTVRGSIDGGLGTGDKQGSIIDVRSLNRGIYNLRATPSGPSFYYVYPPRPLPPDPPGLGWAYKLTVTCPAADANLLTIAGLLGIDLAGANLPIDTTAPVTTISGKPNNPTNATTANFAFAAGETSTYQCQLDGGTWTACTSPKDYVGLTADNHTFSVRATDLAGNLEPTPVSYTWMILTAGDLNGDGVVNMIDAILALQLLSGMDMTGKTIRLLADVDGGGRIGPAEVVFILQKAAGLRTP